MRFLKREPNLLEEVLSASELFDRLERGAVQLVVLGPRLPDLSLVATIERIRAGPGRRVSVLAMIPQTAPPGTEGLALEAEAVRELIGTSDAREGMDAFIAKRPPRFTGV